MGRQKIQTICPIQRKSRGKEELGVMRWGITEGNAHPSTTTEKPLKGGKGPNSPLLKGSIKWVSLGEGKPDWNPWYLQRGKKNIWINSIDCEYKKGKRGLSSFFWNGF